MLACFCDEQSISILPFDELRCHFKVDFFHDTEAFKEALRINPYSAILLNDDVNLLRSIQTESSYNGCPIIIATSSEAEDIRGKTSLSGAYGFYTKSMKASDLIFTLKKVRAKR